MKQNNRKKVYVGLSGGVDSSTSAALLKKAGYDVIGVFIKVWQPDFLPCTWKEDRLDAMRVAAHLDIPFITINLQKEYKKEVVDYMIGEYIKGRTPNPDVMCNQHVKFGAFFRKAIAAGADFVATGHYAQITKNKNGSYNLFAGVDGEKDQSYFLWTLTQKELSKTLFPVGAYKKSEVRKLAKKFGLPTAEKKDSQGLCFLGKLDMKDFLKHFIHETPGDVLNEEGAVIGTHTGVVFLTHGERHGFTITSNNTQSRPYYVIAKNIKQNTIIVSHKQLPEKKSGMPHIVTISALNWTRGILPEPGKQYRARVRYRQPLEVCSIVRSDTKKAEILFIHPQIVASGQSLVVYDGDECLGGGIID